MTYLDVLTNIALALGLPILVIGLFLAYFIFAKGDRNAVRGKDKE